MPIPVTSHEDLLLDVREAQAHRVEADRAVAAAETTLAQARAIAHPGFSETRDVGPPPPTAVERFRARLRLASLEATLAGALEAQEAARAALTRAQTAAQQEIAQRFREIATPAVTAVRAALDQFQHAYHHLDTLVVRAAEQTAAAGGGSGAWASYRFAYAGVLWAYAAQLARLAEAPEPPAAALPAGWVRVRCLRQFNVRLDGTLDPITANVGFPFSAGAPIRATEECGVRAEAAEVLVAKGLAEMVA